VGEKRVLADQARGKSNREEIFVTRVRLRRIYVAASQYSDGANALLGQTLQPGSRLTMQRSNPIRRSISV
jgi:hypothetical protein